jgi:hypothetical protein
LFLPELLLPGLPEKLAEKRRLTLKIGATKHRPSLATATASVVFGAGSFNRLGRAKTRTASAAQGFVFAEAFSSGTSGKISGKEAVDTKKRGD